MKTKLPLAFALLLVGVSLLAGCATAPRVATPLPTAAERPRLVLPRETEDRILALDPERVSGQDITGLLSNLPAPRVVNIHGGIYPVYLAMKSFSRFLVGMGYPEVSITNPGNGKYSFSCYTSSARIAGAVGWYYEQEPLRPVLVGHSQGGMQAVKVLYKLTGSSGALEVWNPLTRQFESRTDIRDPLTGQAVPLTSLRLPYATAVGSGGFTRLLPNQWDMLGRLRKIPDSVEDFSGYYMGFDLFGGDLLGFGPMNEYAARGSAHIRNVRLPIGDNHVTVPVTKHLLKSQEVKDWINAYTPTDHPKVDAKLKGDTTHLLWAAEVWYSLKKHWVLELQRVIRAQRTAPGSAHERGTAPAEAPHDA